MAAIRVEPEDDEIAEEWTRGDADLDPETRGVIANRWRDEDDWPWQVFIAAAEFVRQEPLESELEARLIEGLRRVDGVEDVAREDREVWVVRGHPTGAALVDAAAAVVDELAPRMRQHIDALDEQSVRDGRDTPPGQEIVLSYLPRVLCSKGTRAKLFLPACTMGDLVLTTHRVLFLASKAPALVAQFGRARAEPLVVAGETAIETLDLSALDNPRSLEVPIDRVEEAQVKRRWDLAYYVWLRVRSEGLEPKQRTELDYSFMTKFSLRKNSWLEFVALLHGTRSGDVHSIRFDA